MSRLTRGGTAELVSLDQILKRERRPGNFYFPCSADHEQDWQPYSVDPSLAMCDDHTYIHIHTHTYNSSSSRVRARIAVLLAVRIGHGGESFVGVVHSRRYVYIQQ